MENQQKFNWTKISQIGGGIGTIGGLVADVLTPLAPISAILAGVLVSLGILTYFLIKNEKLTFANKTNSLILIVSGVIFFGLGIVADDDKGLLASNIPAIQSFQESMNIVSEKLNVIDEKIDKVGNNIEEGFESMEENFENIENLIKANNPIDNPTTASDFIVNAYLFLASGDERRSLKSFEDYLKLTEAEKLDVYKDYYSVCLSVNGKAEAKIKLESLNSKMANLVLLDANEETLDGFLNSVKELELENELNCIAYRMNLTSARRTNNVTNISPIFKSSLKAYSNCNNYSIADDFSAFEYLFLNNTKIPDYWEGSTIDANDYLKNLLNQLAPLDDKIILGGMLQQYITGSPSLPNFTLSESGDIIGFEKDTSPEYLEYLEIWKQFCGSNGVDWVYN